VEKRAAGGCEHQKRDDLDEIMVWENSYFPPQTPQPSASQYKLFLLNSPILLGDHILEVDGMFPLPGTHTHAWLVKRASKTSEAERACWLLGISFPSRLSG
jgi:hypothetical protein